MRFAARSVEITPGEALPLAGYHARGTAPSSGAHDPLTANLLVLRGDGGTGVVCWVTLDVLCVDTATAARISATVAERAGIPREAMLVCASHTHSAPAAWFRPELPALAAAHLGGDGDDGPLAALVQRIGDAAGTLSTTEPASVRYGAVPDVGLGGNRYDPDGQHLGGSGVLSVRDARDRLRAVVFDYACHPTVLGHDNLAYSADYLAATREALCAALPRVDDVPERPVPVFLQGAAGDASTRFTRRGQTFAESARAGGILAAAVLRGVLTGQDVDPTGPVVRRARVRVPTRALPGAAEAARHLAEAEAAWQAAGGLPDVARRIARTRREGALLLRDLVRTGLPPAVELPVTAVTLGDLVWLHLPVEPFARYGREIVAASPFPHTHVVGYTDGYFGYLADRPAHSARAYEAASGIFDPAGAEALADAAVGLLRR